MQSDERGLLMIYVFSGYELDTDRYELRLAGAPLRIEPKVFDLLAYLLQHPGHFVSREDLHERLWPDQYVTDSALTYCITAARKVVGDNGRAQRIIKPSTSLVGRARSRGSCELR